ELRALGERRCCLLVVAEPMSIQTYADQRTRYTLCIFKTTGEGESLLDERVRTPVVPEPVDEETGPEECLQARPRLFVVRSERLLAPVASLAQMAAHIPEAHQRPHEPELFGTAAGVAQ